MSPDGEAIVTGAGDETLRFWNVFSKTRSTKVKWVGISARCSPTCVPSACPGASSPVPAAQPARHPVSCALPGSPHPLSSSCITWCPCTSWGTRRARCPHRPLLRPGASGSLQAELPSGAPAAGAQPSGPAPQPAPAGGHRTKGSASLLCALQESVSVLNLFTRIR